MPTATGALVAWYHNQDLVLADISPGAAAGEVLYRGGISDELSLDHRPQRLLVHQLVHRGESCQVGTLGTKPREVVRAFRCSFLANDTILAIDDRTVESGGTGDYLATVLTLDGRQLAQRHLPDFPEGSTSGNQLTGGAARSSAGAVEVSAYRLPSGKRTTLVSGRDIEYQVFDGPHPHALAWRPDGTDVWFGAIEDGRLQRVGAVQGLTQVESISYDPVRGTAYLSARIHGNYVRIFRVDDGLTKLTDGWPADGRTRGRRGPLRRSCR